MSVLDNTILTTDVTDPRDVLAVLNFAHEYDRFEETVGLFPVETVSAGTKLVQYEISGELGDGTVDEGDEVTLTKYTAKKTDIGTPKVYRYKKMTTAEAIQKSGIDIAVTRTDAKMASQLRAKAMKDLFTLITTTGTSTADAGTSIQSAIANVDAKLQDVAEKTGDSLEGVIYFANMYDVAAYMGEKTLTTETLFGLRYLTGYLGVEHLILTNQITKGEVYATPVENIHVYGVDFGALSDSGLVYEDLGTGIIGFHHDADYDRDSVMTYAKISANFVPEVKDYIVKGTISPLE